MNQTVDTRTVEMRFDNKNFESNVKQSMSTLDKLKRSLKLDGASSGLKEVERNSKKIEFKDLNRNIDGIGKRFSVLETIATGALLRIGAKAADLGAKLVKSLSIDQAVSGWNKYAEETTAVQTIMANLKDNSAKFVDEASKMEYVEGLLEKLMWFSDETSYNFTDMTGNIGKFIANGQDLDESVTAMQGIATWAAKSGQNAQTASRAMYNISQAMGVGAMTGIDWKSIEIANMATAEFKNLAIQTGEYLGKIKKGEVTINNFRDSLAKKWFDKDVMMTVFKTYGGVAEIIHDYAIENELSSTEAIKNIKNNKKLAEELGIEIDSVGFKAFMAAQEAKTFGEVMAATADAVSTKWSRFFKNIFGNYLEAKELWTNLSEDLWNIFAAPIDELNLIMSKWKEGFFKGGPMSILEKAFQSGVLDKLQSGYAFITKEGARQAELLDSSVYSIEQMEDGTKRLYKNIKKADGSIERWYKTIYDSDSLLSGRDLLIGGFKNLMETFFTGYETEAGKEVLSIFQAIRAAFREIFFPEDDSTSIAKRLWDLTKRFKEFTDRIKPTEETVEKIKNAFKGLFTVFKIGYKIVKSIIKPFKDIFRSLFAGNPSKGILNLADSMGTWIQELERYLEKGKKFENISIKIRNGLDLISKTLTGLSLSDLITKIRTDVIEFFKNFKFDRIFKTIDGWIKAVNLRGVFETITGLFGSAIDFLKKTIAEISQINTGELPEKLTPIQNFWITIRDFVKGIDFVKIFNIVVKVFTSLVNSIKKVIIQIKQINSGDISKALTPFQNFWIGLTEIFKGLKPIIPIIFDAFGKIIRFIGESISKLANANKLNGQLTPLQKYWEGIKEIFKGIKSILIILSGPFKKISTFIGEFLSSIADAVSLNDRVTKSVHRSIKRSSTTFDGFKDFIKGLLMFFSSIGFALGKILSVVGKVFATIGVIIKKFVESHSIEQLINILLKGGIFVALIVIAMRIKWTTEAIRELIEGLGDISFAIKRRLNISAISTFIKSITVLVVGIAAAVTLMTASVKQIGIGKVLAISGILFAFLTISMGIALYANKMSKALTKAQLRKFTTLLALMSGFMIAAAASLIIVAQAFKKFANIKFDNSSVAFITFIFAGFIATVSIIALAAKEYLAKGKGSSKLVVALASMSGFMMAVAASLVILSRAYAIIGKSKIDPSTFFYTSIVFSAFIIFVTGIAMAIKKHLSNVKNVGKLVSVLAVLSGFMIAAAASLIIVAQAFKKFANIKFNNAKLWQIGIVFAAFTLIVTGMAALASVLMKNASAIAGVAVMAGFMVTAAASLAIVAIAFSKLSNNISPAQMGAALTIMITFGAIVAILAAVGSVLAGTGVGLAGMALVAVIIAAIGFACLGAGAGISMFINSISNLIETFIILMEATTKYGQQFIDSISLIIDAALDAIVNSQEKLKNAAISVMTAIAEAIIVGAPIISKALIILLINIMENVKETIDVSTKILADTLAVATVALIDAMGNALRKNAPYLAKAFRNLIEAVIEAAIVGAAAILEPLGKFGKKAAKIAVDEWIPSIRKAFEIVDEEQDSVINDLIKRNEELEDSSTSTLQTLLDMLTGQGTILDGEKVRTFFEDLIPNLGSIWGGEIDNVTNDVKKRNETVQKTLKSAFDLGYLDTIDNGYGYVSRYAAEQAVAADSTLYTIEKLEDGTDALMKNIKNADGSIDRFFIKIYDAEPSNAISDLLTSIKGPLAELSGDMFPSGSDMISNLISGMESKFPELEDVSNRAASIVSAPIHCSEPDVGPLSDLHTYGPDLIIEWCKGMSDNFDKIDETSDSMAQRIKDGFTTALDYLISLIDGGMSDDLTIRPILDLSEIQNGAKELDSIINSRNGYSLRGTADLASSAAYNMRSITKPVQQTIEQPVSAGNNTYNNTFYITNSDPNAVAEKVSRIIQQQVVRKQAVWAK